MSDTALLAWGLLTLSLLNLILLTWLGLTVLLNTDRRDGAAWIIAVALLGGAIFFLCHAVVVSRGAAGINPALFGQWPLAWAGGFLLPCAWYVVALWYAGFWKHPGAMPRYRLHRAFLVLTCAVLIFTGLLIVATGMSLIRPYELPYLLGGPAVAGVPVVVLPYTVMIVLCVGMTLAALAEPAPSSRLMGDLARRRARPWLTAATFALFVVGLLVGGALLAFSPKLARMFSDRLTPELVLSMGRIDLLVLLAILAAIVLLGEGIISYELFTGRTLPRRGLRRTWHVILLLALGYSACIALALQSHVPPIYAALAATVGVTALSALSNWREHREREHTTAELRAFVAGPRLLDALLATPTSAPAPFRTLCDDVLHARSAMLLPLGTCATLVTPQAHPADLPLPSTECVAELTAGVTPQTLCLPLDPAAWSGAAWGVPLWGTAGLIGLLLLGEKHDGGLFSAEEVEIARAGSERLLDALAGAQMAQRLLQVQRARIAESRVVDGRTRRAIHDEVLPQLHAALLALSAGGDAAEVAGQLSQAHRQLSDVLRAMPGVAGDLARHGLFAAVRNVAEGEFREAFDTIRWTVPAEVEETARVLSPLTAEVLFGAAREALRNAARYGRGDNAHRPLGLAVTATLDNGLCLVIADDGVGVAAGQSSASAGQGMLLHGTMLAIVGGAWHTDSSPAGTRITLTVPK